jgi:uncharacterized Zn finger protein (UPF0148 family)
MAKEKIWARYFDKCRMCGTVKIEHRQEGFCKLCWGKERYRREKPKYQEYNRQYWIKNREKLIKKNRDYYNKVIKKK